MATTVVPWTQIEESPAYRSLTGEDRQRVRTNWLAEANQALRQAYGEAYRPSMLTEAAASRFRSDERRAAVRRGVSEALVAGAVPPEPGTGLGEPDATGQTAHYLPEHDRAVVRQMASDATGIDRRSADLRQADTSALGLALAPEERRQVAETTSYAQEAARLYGPMATENRKGQNTPWTEGEMGLQEYLGTTDWTEKTPFYGTFEKGVKGAVLLEALERVYRNESINDVHEEVLQEWLKAVQQDARGMTVGAKIADMVLDMPKIMIEMAATGGVLKGAGAAGGATLKRLMAQVGVKGVEKYLATRTAAALGKVAVGGAARAALMSGGTVAKTAERQARHLQRAEDGSLVLTPQHESLAESALKAYADDSTEYATELVFAGLRGVGLKSAATARVPAPVREFAKKNSRAIVAKVHQAWQAVTPEGSIGDFIRWFWSEAGKGNPFEEWAEERVGSLARAVTGIEDFGAGEAAGVMDRVRAAVVQDLDPEQILVEGVAFTLGSPQAAQTVIGAPVKALDLAADAYRETPYAKRRQQRAVLANLLEGEPVRPVRLPPVKPAVGTALDAAGRPEVKRQDDPAGLVDLLERTRRGIETTTTDGRVVETPGELGRGTAAAVRRSQASARREDSLTVGIQLLAKEAGGNLAAPEDLDALADLAEVRAAAAATDDDFRSDYWRQVSREIRRDAAEWRAEMAVDEAHAERDEASAARIAARTAREEQMLAAAEAHGAGNLTADALEGLDVQELKDLHGLLGLPIPRRPKRTRLVESLTAAPRPAVTRSQPPEPPDTTALGFAPPAPALREHEKQDEQPPAGPVYGRDAKADAEAWDRLHAQLLAASGREDMDRIRAEGKRLEQAWPDAPRQGVWSGPFGAWLKRKALPSEMQERFERRENIIGRAVRSGYMNAPTASGRNRFQELWAARDIPTESDIAEMDAILSRWERDQGSTAAPAKGAAAAPELSGTATAAPGEGVTVTPQIATARVPVQQFPTARASIDNRMLPNIKRNANPETGLIEGKRLNGQYRQVATPAIVLWETRDGRFLVATGRHKFDLAQRNGEPTIPAQVLREADGWTREHMRIVDAESNILDEQGEVDDYAAYFREIRGKITEDEAAARSLTERAKGRMGFLLGTYASDDLYASFFAGRIGAATAAAIADVGRGDAGLQAAGMSKALQTPRPSEGEVRQYLAALRYFGPARKATQGDIFNFDDSALRESEAMGKAASVALDDLTEDVRILRQAVQRGNALELTPEQARKYQVRNRRNPAQIARALQNAQQLLARWEKWATDKELFAEIRRLAGLDGGTKGAPSGAGKPAETPAPPTTASTPPAAQPESDEPSRRTRRLELAARAVQNGFSAAGTKEAHERFNRLALKKGEPSAQDLDEMGRILDAWEEHQAQARQQAIAKARAAAETSFGGIASIPQVVNAARADRGGDDTKARLEIVRALEKATGRAVADHGIDHAKALDALTADDRAAWIDRLLGEARAAADEAVAAEAARMRKHAGFTMIPRSFSPDEFQTVLRAYVDRLNRARGGNEGSMIVRRKTISGDDAWVRYTNVLAGTVIYDSPYLYVPTEDVETWNSVALAAGSRDLIAPTAPAPAESSEPQVPASPLAPAAEPASPARDRDMDAEMRNALAVTADSPERLRAHPEDIERFIADAAKYGYTRAQAVEWLRGQQISDRVRTRLDEMERAAAGTAPSSASAEAASVEAKPGAAQPQADSIDLDAELSAALGEFAAALTRQSFAMTPENQAAQAAEILRTGSAVAGLLIRKGVRTFERFAQFIRDKVPQLWDQAKPYLHGVWSTAVAGQTAEVQEQCDDLTRRQADTVLARLDVAETPQSTPAAAGEAGSESPEAASAAPGGPVPAAGDSSADLAAIEQIQKRVGVGMAPLTRQAVNEILTTTHGGGMASGRVDAKHLTDLVEAAVNRTILASPYLRAESQFTGNPETGGRQALEAVRRLKDYVQQLPTQSTRTAESDRMQQFSTPPFLAYVAAWAGALRSSDVVLEPSAGIGGLAVFAKARGATVIANELSPRRAALLRLTGTADHVRELNAEQIHALLLPEIVQGTLPRPTVVVMNPPFSHGAVSGENSTMVGGKHLEQALELLAPGGRLVAIVGEGMAADKPRFRAWWTKIGRQYRVRANIGVAGEEYRKYGTTFGNQLVVIDKTGPTVDPASIVTGRVERVEDLVPMLREVRDDRTAIETAPAEPSSGTPAEGDGGRPAGKRPGSVRPGGSGGGGGVRGGRPGNAQSGKPAAAISEEPVPDAGDRAGVDPGKRDQSAAGDTGGGRRAPAPAGTAQGLSVTVRDGGGEIEAVGDDGVFAVYSPAKVKIAGARPHPTELVESAVMASVPPVTPAHAPKIPQKIVTSGDLSEAQLEQIVYAGQAHSKMLPSGERQGYFVGDGTGVGKGRIIAGTIQDNWYRGRRKAVWISKKPSLIEDAVRDWTALGMPKDAMMAFGKKMQALPAGKEGVAFLSYTGLAKNNPGLQEDGKLRPSTKPSRMKMLFDWLGPDFDGVIALDEVHLAGNAVETTGKFGRKKPSQRALAVVDLQRLFPKARILYVSATGATDVTNLSYADRLGIWGPGRPFASKHDFFEKIAAGGISAMEIVSRDLKAMGLYLARTLSFRGVEQRSVVHQLTADQRAMYDEISKAWSMVFANVDDAMARSGAENSSQARMAAMSAFWGAQQRFYNQLLTALQMPTVLREIREDLEKGLSVVLQVVNTNEATLTRALSEQDSDDADLEDLDLTPRKILQGYVDTCFPTTLYEPVQDADGNVRWKAVLDAQGNHVQDPRAVELKNETLAKLSLLKVPDNPLEMLMDEFGADKVAEVTGRSRRVVWGEDAKGDRARVTESRSDARVANDVKEFLDGRRRILVFSDAGGTGFSYHAGARFRNQERRAHYVLQAGWRADGALQGMGRTHRSDQVVPPIYRLVSTDLKGHQRFISTIARRLGQLGALTSGERAAAGSGLFSEEQNLENKYSDQALYQLFMDGFRGRLSWTFMELARLLGFVKNRVDESSGERRQVCTLIDPDTGSLSVDKLPNVPQFLNRILAVPVDTQNALFEEFLKRLNDAVQLAKVQETFDPGTQERKSVGLIRVTADDEVHRTDTGAVTRLVDVEVDETRTLFPWESRWDSMADGSNGLRWIRNRQNGRVYAVWTGPDITKENGSVVASLWRQGPASLTTVEESSVHVRKAGEMTGNYDELPRAEAKRLWTEQYEAEPKVRTVKETYIVGAFLPVWDRIAMSYPRIYRLKTDRGSFLGAYVRDSALAAVRARLGAGAGRKVTPEEVWQGLLAGQTYDLANGWRLKRSRVNQEPRIEVIGIEYAQLREWTDFLGGYTERIQWDMRAFLPTDEATGLPALRKVLERAPVVDTPAPAGRSTKYREGRTAADEYTPDPAALGQARRILREMLGDLVTVRMVDRMATPDGARALGSYQERLVRLVSRQARPQDTAMHEAVHAVLDLVLDPAERAALIRAAGSEEALADGIIHYANTRTGFTGAARRLVDRLLDVLEALFGVESRRARLNEFYRRMLGGEYAAWTSGAVGQGRESAAAYRQDQTDGAQDAEYLAAVERGDMDAAQRMVDEAAGRAGYTAEGWHGTWRDFTVFNRLQEVGQRIGLKLDTIGSWFTDSAKTARMYGPKARRYWLALRNPLRLDGLGGAERLRDMAAAAGSGEALRSALISQWHDGIVIEGDIVDGELQTIRIAFEPEQIKDAAPVARDDDGRVIPLSERFQAASPDVRYRRAESESEAVALHERLLDKISRGPLRDRNARPELSQARRMLGTISNYADRVPGLRRMYDAAMKLADERHQIGEAIFGKNEEVLAELRRFAKQNRRVWRDKIEPYLWAQDRDADGPHVKPDGRGGWEILTPSGESMGHAMDEATAWRTAHFWEMRELMHPERGRAIHARLLQAADGTLSADEAQRRASPWTYEEAKAVYIVRALNDAQFEVLFADARALREAYAELGMAPPSVSTPDGRTLDIWEALREMGDRRGYYMPRLRSAGRYKLHASKDGEQPRTETFSDPISRRWRAGRLRAQGWKTIAERSSTPSEDAAQDVSPEALQDFVNNALSRLSEGEAGVPTLQRFDLRAITETYRRKTDGKDEEHLVVSSISGKFSKPFRDLAKVYGGFPDTEAGTWRFPNPSEDLEEKLAQGLAFAAGSGTEVPLAAFTREFGRILAQMIHSRGSRARKIGRGQQVGMDVRAGYETDALRAVVLAGRSTAGGTAKARMARRMLLAISGTTESWDEFEARTEGIYPSRPEAMEAYRDQVQRERIDSALQPNAYAEAVSYMRWMLTNESDAERVMGALRGLAAVWHLSGLAPAAVNLTGLFTAVPAAIHAYTGASAASVPGMMLRAMRDYTAWWRAINTGAPPTTADAEALQEMHSMGWDTALQSREALDALVSRPGRAWARVSAAMLVPFGVTEQLNRGTTLLAAYRAARARGKDHAEAMKAAKMVSDKAHAVYGKANLPAFARGSGYSNAMARSWYMYKTYTHNYLQVLAELSVTDRLAAAWMLLAPGILGGLAAVPAATTVSAVFRTGLVRAVLEAAGIEPPDDPEEWVYATAEELFGDAGEDLARTGLAGLLGLDVRGSLDARLQEWIPATITDLMGAPASLGLNAVQAAELLARGDPLKAAEKLAPRAIAAPIRGWREYHEGATTFSGAPIYWGDERVQATMAETLARSLGFAPERLSNISRRQWAERTVRRDYTEERQELYARYRALVRAGETSGPRWRALHRDIHAYNTRARASRTPGVTPVTPATLKGVATKLARPPSWERSRAE